MAVGAFSRSGDAYDLTLAEGRHRKAWSIQPTPGVRYVVDPWGGEGTLNGVSCMSTTACVAVGDAGSEVHLVPIVERWDGRGWRLEASARGVHDGTLLGVSCTSSTTCVAVGINYAAGSQASVPLVERRS
jgi:hypothetical protein